MKSIANLALLLVLFMFIYTLIGMQFLSGPSLEPYDPDDVANQVTQDFNSFPNAAIVVFILVTAEGWNSFTAEFIYNNGWVTSMDEDDEKPPKPVEQPVADGPSPEIIEEELDYIQEKLRILARVKKGTSS
jgi:hypothetical protein